MLRGASASVVQGLNSRLGSAGWADLPPREAGCRYGKQQQQHVKQPAHNTCRHCRPGHTAPPFAR